MLSKNDLLDVMLHECDICIHLYGKLPEGSLDYRPTPQQRSTLELLRYLSFCGIGGTRYMVENNYERFTEAAERANDMPADEFPAAMERQKKEIRDVIENLSDDDFANKQVKMPPDQTVKLGRALLEAPLSWLTAYRMQLFLYAKAAGNHEIGTANCWAGIDWPA